MGRFAWKPLTVITVAAAVAVVIFGNVAPTAEAGANQSATINVSINIVCTGTDDGLPSGSSLAYTWSKTAGTGTCNFGNTASASTTLECDDAATFTIQCLVSDGALSATDTFTFTVASGTALTAYAGLTREEIPSAVNALYTDIVPPTTTRSVTVSTGANFTTECATGGAVITVDTTISSIVNCLGDDNYVQLNDGVTINGILLSTAGNQATRFHIRGKGPTSKVGAIFCSTAGCDDLWIDSLLVDTDLSGSANATAFSFAQTDGVAFTNVIAISDGEVLNQGNFLLCTNCNDVLIANSNIAGTDDAGANANDWGLRFAESDTATHGPYIVVDSRIQAGNGGQNVIRFNGKYDGAFIVDSTIVNRRYPRVLKDVAVDTANPEPDNTSNNVYVQNVSFYLQCDSNDDDTPDACGFTFQFGGGFTFAGDGETSALWTGTDLHWHGDSSGNGNVTSSSITTLEGNANAGETWNYHAGTPTYANDGASLPAWGLIVTPYSFTLDSDGAGSDGGNPLNL